MSRSPLHVVGGSAIDRTQDHAYRRIAGERDQYRKERNAAARLADRRGKLLAQVVMALPAETLKAYIAAGGQRADIGAIGDEDFGSLLTHIRIALDLE